MSSISYIVRLYIATYAPRTHGIFKEMLSKVAPRDIVVRGLAQRWQTFARFEIGKRGPSQFSFWLLRANANCAQDNTRPYTPDNQCQRRIIAPRGKQFSVSSLRHRRDHSRREQLNVAEGRGRIVRR